MKIKSSTKLLLSIVFNFHFNSLLIVVGLHYLDNNFLMAGRLKYWLSTSCR